MNNEFKSILSKIKKKNIKILDLGCGHPIEIFKFLKEHRLNNDFHYTGVDIDDEFKIYHNRPEEYLPERYNYEPNELMLSLFNNVEINNTNTNTYSGIDSLIPKFNFYFNSDILEFTNSKLCNSTFDVIILSNILHKLSQPSDRTVLNKCISCLSNDGFVYISVLRDNYEQPKKEDNLYSKERYSKLIENLNVIWDNLEIESLNHFISICKINK
jgi:chemotaxis methyl-accepting protein methylase